jgi:hypothetical protein
LELKTGGKTIGSVALPLLNSEKKRLIVTKKVANREDLLIV